MLNGMVKQKKKNIMGFRVVEREIRDGKWSSLGKLKANPSYIDVL